MDVKTRHYQQLSHQLSKLQENISESKHQFKTAASQLEQMERLSISHASQCVDRYRFLSFANLLRFMAVSKIIDKQESQE